MNGYGIPDVLFDEHQRRVTKTRSAIRMAMTVLDEDETSMLLRHPQYYLQVSFSLPHPLMVIGLARELAFPCSGRQWEAINMLNLHSILGCHAINDDLGCYTYRATQWLDTDMDSARFLEILGRCAEEADKGYRQLLQRCVADGETDSCN